LSAERKIGRASGATRSWILRATPGCRRMRRARSSVSTICGPKVAWRGTGVADRLPPGVGRGPVC